MPRGESGAALKAGDQVAVDGVLDANGTYGLIRVQHKWTVNGYENEFLCTPWKRYTSPEAAAVPRFDGVVAARVADNNDPEGLGRVQVQYYWQEDSFSCWIRAMTPHAGADRGVFCLPEIGDEVWVMFEEGDPERGRVLGSAWNGRMTPPREELWGGDTGPNDVKRMVTKSGHRISLDDKPGKNAIVVATPEHVKLSMMESSNETGDAMLALHSDGDVFLSAPAGRIHFHSKFWSREAGGQSVPAVHHAAPHLRKPATRHFAVQSAAVISKLPKNKRVTYRRALIAAGRHRASTLSPASQKKTLLAACDRFERNNQAMEMANLSDSVYSDSGAPEGWTRLSNPDKLKQLPRDLQDPGLWSNPKSHLHAALFQSGDGQVVLAYRGTDPKNLKDLEADFSQGWGNKSDQYQQAIKLGQSVEGDFGSKLLGLTGHSLGGGLAAATSIVTGVPATTFNAAGVPPEYGRTIRGGYD